MAIRNTVCLWVERDANDMLIAYHLEVAVIDDVAGTYSQINQNLYPDRPTWINAINSLLPNN